MFKRFESWLRKKFMIHSPSRVFILDCRECRKYKTMECPNSSECYCLDDKPHFEL